MKHKILFIEDDKDQVDLYKVKFGLEGFDFISAYNGLEGVKVAKEQKPDLIFLDIILFEMSGLDVLKQLKDNEDTKNIPVVLLTNLTKKSLTEDGEKLGAICCLAKTGVTLKELTKMAKKIVNS